MINLRNIDDSNKEVCLALRVHEDQKSLVASNNKSLEWVRKNPAIVPKLIFKGDTAVGFLMFEPRGNSVFSMHRLMVDAEWQRCGIGRSAMELAITEIHKQGGVTIYTSTRPENEAAKNLLVELGFEQCEIEPDGEVLFRHGPPRELDL